MRARARIFAGGVACAGAVILCSLARGEFPYPHRVREGGEIDDTQALPGPKPPGTDPAAVTYLLPTTRSGGDPSPAETDRTGEQRGWIGRFVIFEELGAGGMGQVFAAYDPDLDRKVALKLVQRPPDGAGNGDWQARLVREAQAMAKLSHPNVVTVYEVSAHAGQVFLVMELVEGRDLARWLVTPRSWQRIVEVFRAAGEGLAAAHAAGLVHRDFKPANVLVGDDGRVRVADFGLVGTRTARPAGEQTSPTSDLLSRDLTHFGAVIGTPAYMAPEQISGATTDERSDVFSFCVALWEALYGMRPFAGETMTGRLAAIRRGEIREPPESTAPRWLRPLLLRGLSDEPGDRWPGMRPLLDALARDPERERARRRRSALLVTLVLALGGALVYGGSALWSRYRAHAREAAAQRHLDVALARLDALRAEGRKVEANATVDAFVADPEHTGTRAQVKALRWRADQRRSGGDIDGALDAYSEAYAAARDPDEAGEVLLGLATLFREGRAWGPLTWVLASLEQLGPALHARTASLRIDAALVRRAFATVAEIDPSLTGLASVLGQAQRSERRATRAQVIDLEGDGAPEVALFETIGPAAKVTLTRATAGLPVVAVVDAEPGQVVDRMVVAGGPGRAHMIVGVGDMQRRLMGWSGERWEVEASWRGSVAHDTASGDLDGDGVDEIYVGSGPYDRRLVGLRRAGAGWAEFSPSPAIDATRSDVNAVLIGDADGDDRPELLIGLGPWQAYDLRVLRPGAAGQPFEQVARRKLGTIDDVLILPTSEGPLIAVAKSPEVLYASPTMFPEGDHTGAAPGLYLFRLRGRSLEEVAFAAIEPTLRLRSLAVADLDGDGRAELLGDLSPVAGTASELVIFHHGAQGLTQRRIARLVLLAALDLDDDPADELLVADAQDDFRVWTLGVGDERLPELDLGRPQLGVDPPAALAEDLALRRQWVHAGELAGLGLVGAAGRRYAELARALPQGQVRDAALVQAAELATAAGDFAGAAARFEEAARGSGQEALFERAADHYEQSGRFDDAVRVLAEVPRASDAVQQRLRRHIEWLASEREYVLDRPLDPAWRLHDPIALRHDRVRGVLIADLMAPAPVLALPVRVLPDFVLRVELSLATIDFGGSFSLRLRPDDARLAPLEISAYRSGAAHGTEGVQLIFRIVGTDPTVSIPAPQPGDRLTLELSQLATPGEQRLTLAVNDVPIDEYRHSITTPFTGPAQLELLRSDPLGGAVATAPWSRVELRRLVTRGLAVTPAPTGPWDAARSMLVEGEGAAALAALDAAASTSTAPEELPLWRVLALLAADEAPQAAAVLVGTPGLQARDSPAYKIVLRLLRARSDAFAPVLRAAVGPGYLQIFDDAWRDAILGGQFDVPLMRALLEHPPRLDDDDTALPDREQRRLVVSILQLTRAAIYAELRHTASAHQALERVDLDLVVAQLPDLHKRLGMLLLRLAVLDLADDHIDHVFAHLATARALWSPEMFTDLLRAAPGLQALHSDPRWRALLGE